MGVTPFNKQNKNYETKGKWAYASWIEEHIIYTLDLL